MAVTSKKSKSAPLTPEEIEAAVRALQARGDTPKTHRVYAELGCRGSLTTIANYLKQRTITGGSDKSTITANLSAQLQAEITAIKDQAYQEGFKEADNEITELYQQLEEERAAVKARSDAMAFERAQLVAEIERLMKQYTDMKHTHDSHVHERIQLEQRAVTAQLQADQAEQLLEKERQRYEAMMADLKQQLSDAKTLYTKTLDEIQTQHQQDRDALKSINEDQRHQFMQEKDKLLVELKQSYEAIQRFEQTIARLKADQQQSQHLIQRLEQDLHAAQQTHAALQTQLQAAQAQASETSANLDVITARYESLQALKTQLEQQVQQLSTTVARLEQQLDHKEVAHVD